jgi:hypothetical protein
MSQVISRSISGSPLLCHPIENSQASTDGANIGWILYIDCAYCNKTTLCRVNVDADQIDDWIYERGLKVNGY